MSKPTDIELTVGLDASDVKRSAQDLNGAIKDAFDKSAGDSLDTKMQKLQQQMSQTAAKAEELMQKMSKLESTQIPTSEYSEVSKRVEKMNADFDKLLIKQDEMQESGKTWGPSWEQLNDKMESLGTLIREDEAELQSLVDTGKAFTLGSDTEQYQKLSNNLAEVNNKSRILLNSWNQQSKATKKATTETDKYTTSIKKTASGMYALSSASKRASNGLSGIAGGIKQGIRGIFKYALGITTLVMLFRKLRQAAAEGIKNMVMWEGENGKLNKSISSIQSSIATLKNNVGAMVAPLINALAPAITRIIDLLSVAIQKVSMFIAALTGQKTIMVADKVQSNYAKSLDSTAKSAKKAEKALKGYLSPLDEINKYSADKKEDEDTSGAGGGAGGGTFSEVPIDSKILELIQKLKALMQQLSPIIEYIKKLWDKFVEGFKNGLGDWKSKIRDIINNILSIKQSLEYIWNGIKDKFDEWLQSLARLWGTFFGALVSMILTIYQNITGAVAKYLDENKDRIVEALNDILGAFTRINDQISDFLESFARVFDVFGEENGQRVTAALIGIFYDAFLGLAEFISKAMADIIELITQPFIDNEEKIKEALDNALGVIASVLETIKDSVDETVDELNKVYDEHIGPFIDSITEGVSELVGQILDWWNQKAKPVLDELAKKFDETWKQYIQPVLNEAIGLIGDVADVLKLAWEKWLQPFFSWLIQKFGPVILALWNTLGNGLMTWWKILGTIFEALIKSLRAVLQFIVEGFTKGWDVAWENLKEKFVKIWQEMKDKMKAPLNSILMNVEALINTIISGINKMIEALNTFTFDIPDWVPAIGGKTFGFDISTLNKVSLPRLAQGAVIPPNKEFMAVLGDQRNGTNIETPLSTMVDAFNQALAMNGGNNQSITLNLMMPDKRMIAQYAIEGGQVLQMSRGRNPFLLEKG